MKTNLCFDCANRTAVTLVSANGLKYTDYFCSVNNMRIKSFINCPEGYDIDEYEDLLERGEKYDMFRYEAELQPALC